MTWMKSDIPAVIFCGGYSTRMGQPKHQLKLNGTYLWEHQVNKLKKLFNEVYISCRAEQSKDFGSEQLIVDEHSDIGPMAGIIASLEQLKPRDVFVLSVDTPGIELSTMAKIASAKSAEHLACVALDEINIQPLVAKWFNRSLPYLTMAVVSEVYSLTKVIKSNPYGSTRVDSHQLTNLNHWADFEEYLNQSN